MIKVDDGKDEKSDEPSTEIGEWRVDGHTYHKDQYDFYVHSITWRTLTLESFVMDLNFCSSHYKMTKLHYYLINPLLQFLNS